MLVLIYRLIRIRAMFAIASRVWHYIRAKRMQGRR
jgi:hypothetical protein